MKGQVLAFLVTIMFMLVVVAIIVAAVYVSVFMKGAQLTRVAYILSATEQPLSITNGLLQTKLLDGRTLLDEALHALGGTMLFMPQLASRALQMWGIENWRISVASARGTIQLGVTELQACGSNGYCVSDNCMNIPGSSTLSAQCLAGQSCCTDAYDWSAQRYDATRLKGMPACGPDGGYYGVCEPGGCSLGRKDMGPTMCPELPVGNHCCRPFTTDERIKLADTPSYNVMIPLLYPGISGNLTIAVSTLQVAVR